MLAPSDMSARSLDSPDAGSVLLSFLSPAVSLRGLCTLCEVCLLLRGVPPHDSATMSYGYPSSTTSSAPIKCMRIMDHLAQPMPVARTLLCYASACMQHHSCRVDHMCKEFSCGPL